MTSGSDAQKLARLYRAGELTAVTVPSASQEAVRDLVRARDDVRKDLTAARHRLGKFLIRHGHHFSGSSNWTQRFWAWASKLTFEREGERLTFQHHVAEVKHHVERRAALDMELGRIASAEPYAAPVRRLARLRGISTLSALALLVEIGDFRRFKSPRQLMAYLGLVPREYSSGGKEKRGGITKTGNGHVHRLLVEAAWSHRRRPALGERVREALQGQPAAVAAVARRAQERLHRRFGRLVSRGKPSQVAVTAVARELCAFTWSLMTA